MNTESDEVNLDEPPLAPENPEDPESAGVSEIPDWIPPTGIQLRKAGVQFDAVRVDGDAGRAAADRLARMTGGAPGPVVQEANGSRAVYFLVPVGAASRQVSAWGSPVSRPVRVVSPTFPSRRSTARPGL